MDMGQDAAAGAKSAIRTLFSGALPRPAVHPRHSSGPAAPTET